MHQKSGDTTQHFGSSDDYDEEDDDHRDPFADEEEDFDADDGDHADDGTTQTRGSWWRNVVGGGTSGTGDDGLDSEDDEEFGDFAMAETEKAEDGGASGSGGADRSLFRPLAVNPAKEAARGLSGLWPFGTRAEKKESGKDSEDEVVVSPVDGEEEHPNSAGSEERPIVGVKMTANGPRHLWTRELL